MRERIRRKEACLAGAALMLALLGVKLADYQAHVLAAARRATTQKASTSMAAAGKLGSAPGAEAVSGKPVTWSHQIAPILYKNCTTCHHPGGAGPFSLLTYDDAQRWARQVETVTRSRYMPPWLPEPGYGSFADARRLSALELALIQRWVATGTQRGDASPVPPSYASSWTLGKPDLILTVAQPYDLAAGGQDVFRNFILPYPLSETEYVRAMEILPGVASLVHHANVLIDRTAQYRRQHESDWREGVPGMELVVDAGKGFDPDGHFLFWKPDTPALVEPDGMPWRLDPGNDLILNMHLKPSGKSERVQAQIGLYFTHEPPKQLPMLLQLDRDDALKIPAGAAAFTVEDEITLPVAVDLLGIYPHAHYLGKEMKVWAILPGGKKEPLIWIRDWDIDRQSVYRYAHALALPAGTAIHMRYVYDNSASNPHNPHSPPVMVQAGNRSEDEMAHLWLQVLPTGARKEGAADPRLMLEEAWMRSRLRKISDDYISLYNLGAALAGEGKARDAANVFDKIVQNRPGDSRSWNALGAADETEGNWQQALTSYSHAVAVDPGNCDARFNLAQLDLKHDLAAESEAAFRALLGDCVDAPEDVYVHLGLGSALVAQANYEPAIAEFLHAQSLNPSIQTLLDLRERLAFAYVQSGDSVKAFNELTEAIKLAPNDSAAHALLAQLLAQTDKLPEAIAEQKIALKLHESDADGWNNLGVFEARNGDQAAARSDFEQAQRIDPENEQAKANLARLSHLAPKP